MNQYNKQTRPNRKKTSSGYRRNSERSSFLSVLLFYVLPFIVVNGIIFILVTAKPKATLTINDSSDYITTTMNLKVKSLLPIKSIEANLDGSPIELTKTGSRTYTATLKSNGSLMIKLTSINKMKASISDNVGVLDDAPPAIKDCEIDDGLLSFRLEDNLSGIDYSTISACTEDNLEITPKSIDQSIGLVTFEYEKGSLIIKVKDKIGNQFQGTITPEGDCTTDDQTTQTE